MIIGVVNRLDVAVRRAVLTGISQVTGKISEHNAAELETDIVEVTAHAGARPDHAEWQGGWYSLSGKSKKYRSLAEATGYGRVDGLKGANCRHDFFPVIEGIDTPLYTKEELANIDPPPFEYNGKTYTYYEATQKQRSMERAIRKTKREILAADKSGDKDRFTEKSVRLRRQREEYDKFSKSAGLLTQNERNQVVGFGRSEASRASWAAHSAQTSGKGPKGAPPISGISGNGFINDSESGISGKHSTKTNENTIDISYINSKEFKNKFIGITGNSKVDIQIYNQAKAQLIHCNGSYKEDMTLINSITGKIEGRQSTSKSDSGVDYNKSLNNAISRNKPLSLISIHNHPTNNPPTGSDIVSNGFHKYMLGVAVTHNGKVFTYKAGDKPFRADFFAKVVDKFREKGYNEFEAITQTLKLFEKDYGIEWSER